MYVNNVKEGSFMFVFIRNISIKGIKSINNKIELIFSKKEIKDYSELKDYNIKSIYGPNGSGKTAIVHAFQLITDIVTKNGYLYDRDHSKYLYELMNKDSKVIEIKIDFFYGSDQNQPGIYTYEIHIADQEGSFEIIYERFSNKSSEYNKEKVIIESSNGELAAYTLPENMKARFTNLLDKRSFSDVFLELLNKKQDERSNTSDDLGEAFKRLAPLYALIFKTRVTLDQKDDHSHVFSNTTEELTRILEFRQENQELISIQEQLGYNARIFDQEEITAYKEDLRRKERFIQLFKPNIKGIKAESKKVKSSKHGTRYTLNEFMDYGDYKIDLELESIGIKKLMNLYSSLKHLSLGGIMIIDELDSHINDVYLVKLVEYVSMYSKGQLIFTTHNVSPMETLKSKKNAIDFMSLSGKITSWTQIGNYSPSNLYKKGMVQGLPFNVDAETFLGVFFDE
jgi:AAA15 family ATPase/GTPase